MYCETLQVSSVSLLQAAAAVKHRANLWRVVSSACDAARAVARMRNAVATTAGPSGVPWNTVNVALRDVDRAWGGYDCVKCTQAWEAAHGGVASTTRTAGVGSGKRITSDAAPNCVQAPVRAVVAALEIEAAAIRLALASHRIHTSMRDALLEGAVAANRSTCTAGTC